MPGRKSKYISALIFALVLILLSVLAFTGYMWYKNYIVYRYTCDQQAIQREKLEQVKNEYEYTTERIHQLAEDVDFAKNLAREKMKLSDVGEIIFHFE